MPSDLPVHTCHLTFLYMHAIWSACIFMPFDLHVHSSHLICMCIYAIWSACNSCHLIWWYIHVILSACLGMPSDLPVRSAHLICLYTQHNLITWAPINNQGYFILIITQLQNWDFYKFSDWSVQAQCMYHMIKAIPFKTKVKCRKIRLFCIWLGCTDVLFCTDLH